MALTTMTPEWQSAANSITLYIINRKRNDEAALIQDAQKPMELYNDWARKSGCAVSGAELALWCVSYMQDLVKSPLKRLVKAAEIDGLFE